FIYNPYGRSELTPYKGTKAYLFFEGEQEGQADPVEASDLSRLLINYNIPIAILDSCQSAQVTGQAQSERKGKEESQEKGQSAESGENDKGKSAKSEESENSAG